MELIRKVLSNFKVAKDGKVEAVFSTLNVVDKDGDVTLPGFLGKQIVSMIPAHDWSHVPIGKGETREEGDEAVAALKMNLEIESARDWHSALKFDLNNWTPIQEWSYTFNILEGGSEYGKLGDKDVRFLKPLEDGSPGSKNWEISPVLVGAGVDTHTRTVKAAGNRFRGEVDAALAVVKSLSERTHLLAEMRAKQGRRLSPEIQKNLAEIIEKMEGFIPGIKELLKSDEDEIAQELLKIQLSRMASGR